MASGLGTLLSRWGEGAQASGRPGLTKPCPFCSVALNGTSAAAFSPQKHTNEWIESQKSYERERAVKTTNQLLKFVSEHLEFDVSVPWWEITARVLLSVPVYLTLF